MSILAFVAMQGTSPYIWIDAVCINQGDQSEKGAQVRMMGEVYAKARKVVAWLPYTPERDRVTSFVNTLYQAISNLYRQKQPVTMQTLSASTGCQDPVAWLQLSKFLEDPWFGRVWITQEVVIPDDIDIMCGKKMIPWKALADVLAIISGRGLQRLLITLVEGKVMNPPSGLEAMTRNYAIRTLFHTAQPRPLSFLLIDCWKCGASDGRDKIFALIGLASDARDPELGPDYSVSDAVVFERSTARLLTRDSSSHRVLHAAGTGLQRGLNHLPSWVPDWTTPFPNTIFGSILTAKYSASGDGTAAPPISYDAAKHSITLRGHLIDTVKWLAEPIPAAEWRITRQGLQAKAAADLAWISHLRGAYPDNTYPGARTPFFPDVLAFSLIANMITPGVAAPPEYREYFELFLKYKDWQANTTAEEWDAHQWDATSERANEVIASGDYSAAMSIGQARRLFVTEKRYLGMGFPGVQKGERICIFRGFITPFVLRQKPGGVYALVGEAYTYGLMDGEGLSMGIEGGITLV